STIVVAPAAFGLTANFLTGGLTYHIVTLGPSINTTSIATGTNGATFATLNMVGPAANIRLANCTVTNAINWAGTAANLLVISTNAAPTPASITLSAAGGTLAWAALSGITFVTNTASATNSFDLKNNTNVTITNPSVVAGGGHIIGG